MQLCVDIGNTRLKTAVFDGKNLVKNIIATNNFVQQLQALFTEHPTISSCIISSVKADSSEIEDFLHAKCKTIILTDKTPVPITNLYKSPETLGKDRLAGVIAAHTLFPLAPVLVIDTGTAIKTDFITASGEYLGGSISPGIAMRFNALHAFTGRLPEVQPDANYKSLTGTTTNESILNGVQNGARFELQGFIDAYSKQYPGLVCVITGGDAELFELEPKNHIFAVPELVLMGLNEILLFNAEA